MSFPSGVDVDSYGNIYVSNWWTGTLTKFASTASGDAVPLATISGADTGVYHPGRLAVAPPLSVLTTSLHPARIGHPYATTLRAGLGTSPYRWTMDGSRLPRGLHLQAGKGTISGLPAQAGKFRIVIKVSDSGRPSMTARQAFVLRVNRS